MAENKLVKYFIFPLLLIVILFLFRIVLDTGSAAAGWSIIVLTGVCVFLLVKKSPLYTIEKDGIYIRGVINQKLHFSEISEIRRIGYDELGVALRFGTRTPGISIGLFYFYSIGEVLMHSGNDNQMVLIKTDAVQIIISPDDPDAFITRISGKTRG